MKTRENLNDFIVGSVPTLIYVSDFITASEQDQLLNNIYQAPVSKWKSLKNRRLQNWGGVVHEKGLLAQNLPPWLTRITQKIYKESMVFPSAINHVLINEYLPDQGIMPHQDGPVYYPVAAILSLGSPVVMDFSPHSNFKLCTDTPGSSIEAKTSSEGNLGIKTDDLLDSHRSFSVILMPRSLLIFKDEAYSEYLHGIKDSEEHQYDGAINIAESLKYNGVNRPPFDLEGAVGVKSNGNLNSFHRTTNRISLTCRVVSKVHKNLFRF